MSASPISSPSARSRRSSAHAALDPGDLSARERGGGASILTPGQSFSYRQGVRLTGTTLACDPSHSANEVVFLSHAGAFSPARGRRAGGRGWQQVLLSPSAFARLDAAGTRLGARALQVDFGRPFALGSLRIEIFPSGFDPGSASLLCTVDDRRLVYTGPLRLGPSGHPAVPEAEVRPAHALCLDATFGEARFSFPPRAEALESLLRAIEGALATGAAPIVLCETPTALELALELEARGYGLRGHGSLVLSCKNQRAVGLPAAHLRRFSGRLPTGHVVLWPVRARSAPVLGALATPRFLLASGLAADPAAVASLRVDQAIPLSARAGQPELLNYAAATGAAEVATFGRYAIALAQALTARGHRAYPLLPPRQIPLFSGQAEVD